MAERTKRQHLVPRFYLEKFCDPSGCLWAYTANAEPISQKPTSAAVETNFYSPIGESGNRFDEAEKVLGTIEGCAAPLWEKVSSGATLTCQEREDFSVFLAAQYLRSPSSVRVGAELAAHAAHHALQVTAADREFYERSVDIFDTENGTQTNADERDRMREYILDPSNYSIDVLRSVGLPILGGIERIAGILCRMKWAVGQSNEQHLITSDCPVTRASSPATHSTLHGDGGFFNQTVRVQFPLSPNRMLELAWLGDERSRIAEIPKALARKMNGLRAAQAEKYVFAREQDCGIKRLCDKWLSKKRGALVKVSGASPNVSVFRKLSQSEK